MSEDQHCEFEDEDWGDLRVLVGRSLAAEQPVGPPDLLPLILLELMLMRGSMENRDVGVYEGWRRQMKRLGHWDERYE